MKIKKGDTVKILKGKDRGKTGKVLKIDLKLGRAMVEGVNVYKKHQRSRQEGEKGQIIEINRSLSIANLMFVCPKCKKPSRLGFRFDEKKNKFRYCKKCKNMV